MHLYTSNHRERKRVTGWRKTEYPIYRCHIRERFLGDSNPELRHPTVTASVTVLKPLCQPVTQTPSAGPRHSTLHILKCTALILVATRIHTLAIVKNKPAKTELTNQKLNP